MIRKNLFIIYGLLVFFTFLYPKEILAVEKIIVTPEDSIQQVIDQVEEGAEVIVSKGKYKDNITINKKISLLGEKGAVIDGQGIGNVIEVNSDGVRIEGLTIINSGKKENEAGILLISSHTIIQNNKLSHNYFGIYDRNGKGNQILHNEITGNSEHFSKRGNGIHLNKTESNKIIGNTITDVQDGIYFDFSKGTTVQENSILNSRYAIHVMYAKNEKINRNHLKKNINGLMIMQAENIDVIDNLIQENINFRGYGALIFDSDKITFKNNQVFYNSTGISLEDARDSTVENNTFAGNQIGLDAKYRNERNTISNNNFIGNIVQTKVLTPLHLSNNYWDDYKGIDLNEDQIGDAPYFLGTMYDRLVNDRPEFQFYFESPAIKVWSAVEELLPIITDEKGKDIEPKMEPIDLKSVERNVKGNSSIPIMFSVFFLISASLIIFYQRRAIQ